MFFLVVDRSRKYRRIRTGGTEISESGRRQGDVPDLYQGVNSSEVCRSPLQRATHRVERIFQPLLLRQAVISKIISTGAAVSLRSTDSERPVLFPGILIVLKILISALYSFVYDQSIEFFKMLKLVTASIHANR